MARISTIGYEGASLEDFVATLIEANIQTIIDVRELPMSRRKGFAKNALREALEKVGIEYVHLRGLGDPKEGRIAARAGAYGKFEKIFLKHMKSEVAKADLERAVSLSQANSSCLLCYERDHNFCHRSYVADSISSIIGVKVRHLGVREGLASDAGKRGSRKGSRAREGTSTSR